MDLSSRVFEAQLAEYLSARDEMLGAINNQHLALTFGTAALVAAYVAGFVSWGADIAPAIFFGIVPLSWWILTMWTGEVVRMLRAVEFCGDQASVINTEIRRADSTQGDALRWERWRRDATKPERTVTWTYVSVGVLLLCTNAAAISCATATAFQRGWSSWLVALVWLALIVAGVPFGVWVLRIFQTWAGGDVGMPDTDVTRRARRLPLLKLPRRRGRSET